VPPPISCHPNGKQRGELVERPPHDLLDRAGQQVGALTPFGDENSKQLLLLLELEEDVARYQRELGAYVAERWDGAADLAYRFEPRKVALDPGAGRGGLFHHFRTKEAVLVAGIERHLRGSKRYARSARHPTARRRTRRAHAVARYVFLELEEEQELLRVSHLRRASAPPPVGRPRRAGRAGTFNEFAALLARSGGTEIGAALALGSLVAFASAELLLGQAPVDADREEVIATWVRDGDGLIEAPHSTR